MSEATTNGTKRSDLVPGIEVLESVLSEDYVFVEIEARISHGQPITLGWVTVDDRANVMAPVSGLLRALADAIDERGPRS